MREIKFRAWDKTSMVYFELADLEQNETLGANKTVNLDDCILMQFTGLKDKNGKEIYKGDVVTGFDKDVIGQIGWSENDCAFWLFKVKENGDLAHGEFLNPDYMDHFEIIGNIYKNPELIK